MMPFFGWGLIAFGISFLSTVAIKRIAVRFHLLYKPTKTRKIHQMPIPQLGGVAIYVAISLVLLLVLFLTDNLVAGEITSLHFFGFFLGGFVLMLGGVLDDRFDVPPFIAILAPICAAVIVIAFGIEIEKLTNPFGGVIYLEAWQSDLLVFVWLMIVMYTTKFLDGLDGLATSVTGIGAFMIMMLALSVAYYQPDVALFAAVAVGALLGFLFWNFHPATIFLGEGGSTFVGYLLGVLAVISGGKLATALLVLGIPLLDVIWVVLRRARTGGVLSIFKGDRKHLHHRLLDAGLGQRQIVFLYVFIATTFGVSAIFLQSREKLVALTILGVLMLIVATVLVQKEQQRYGKEKSTH